MRNASKSFRFFNARIKRMSAWEFWNDFPSDLCATLQWAEKNGRRTKRQHTFNGINGLCNDTFKQKRHESDSSISSESKNDDNDDICVRDMQTLYCILMTNKVRGKMIATEKITDYVERVIPNYSKYAFKEHFNINIIKLSSENIFHLVLINSFYLYKQSALMVIARS